VKRILLWVILAAALVIGYLIYRPTPLNVAPDAQRQIDKAKQR